MPQFDIVKAFTVEDLIHKVNEKLKDGFKIYGNIIMIPLPRSDVSYCLILAVVKFL